LAALIGPDERPEFVAGHPWGCYRRRMQEWPTGHGPALLRIRLTADDRIIGLDLGDQRIQPAGRQGP